MSLLRPFAEARAVLEIPADADAAAIKRAYRKLALAHPPDTDAEGFRRVRDAYELLTDPWSRAKEMLMHPEPMVAPPPLPSAPAPAGPGELPLALLRLAAARVDAAHLLATPGETSPSAAPAPAATSAGRTPSR
jgi:hypothetical protein